LKNLTAFAELNEGLKYLIMKQDIHFNHHFSSVNAWFTKRRRTAHLYAIKIKYVRKQYIKKCITVTLVAMIGGF